MGLQIILIPEICKMIIFSMKDPVVCINGVFWLGTGDYQYTIIHIRDAFQKKIAEKETLVDTGGRGLKKSPFF